MAHVEGFPGGGAPVKALSNSDTRHGLEEASSVIDDETLDSNQPAEV